MKATTFLEIHNALLNKKSLEQCSNKTGYEGLNNGLCSINFKNGLLDSVDSPFKDYFAIPLDKNGFKDRKEAKLQGYTDEDNNIPAYWARDNSERGINDNGMQYNNIRQNIILLCAAINGEL